MKSQMRKMKVKREHGVNCVYLPSWLADQFEAGQHVTVVVKDRKVVGKVSKNGRKKLVILPHFIKEGNEITRVGV